MRAAGPLASQPTYFDLSEKFVEVDACVVEGDLQGRSIDLVVEWEDDAAAIRMDHFQVTPPTRNLNEPEATQGGEHLSTRGQGHAQSVRSTTSRPEIGSTSAGSGSR